MDGFNSVTLCGTVGQDPEYNLINSPSGKSNPKASFSMVTNRTYKDSQGQKQQDANWHSIEVWGPQADVVKNYVRKGNVILVEGELRYSQWDDKQSGQKRVKAYVYTRKVTLLPNQRQDNAQPQQGQQAQPAQQAQMQQGQRAQVQQGQQAQVQQNVNEYMQQQQQMANAVPQGQTFDQNDFYQGEVDDLPF